MLQGGLFSLVGDEVCQRAARARCSRGKNFPPNKQLRDKSNEQMEERARTA